MTPYQLLDVEPDASSEEIERAYRAKARRAHPDAGGSAEAMAELNGAIAILRDPEAREQYDRTGEAPSSKPSAMARLAEIVVPAFMGALQANGPMVGQRDLILATRSAIQRDRNQCSSRIGEGQSALGVFARAKSRLRFSGKGDDLIGRAIDQQAEQIENAVKAGQEMLERYDEALEFLEAYEYETDAPAAMATMAEMLNPGSMRPMRNSTNSPWNI